MLRRDSEFIKDTQDAIFITIASCDFDVDCLYEVSDFINNIAKKESHVAIHFIIKKANEKKYKMMANKFNKNVTFINTALISNREINLQEIQYQIEEWISYSTKPTRNIVLIDNDVDICSKKHSNDIMKWMIYLSENNFSIINLSSDKSTVRIPFDGYKPHIHSLTNITSDDNFNIVTMLDFINSRGTENTVFIERKFAKSETK